MGWGSTIEVAKEEVLFEILALAQLENVISLVYHCYEIE